MALIPAKYRLIRWLADISTDVVEEDGYKQGGGLQKGISRNIVTYCKEQAALLFVISKPSLNRTCARCATSTCSARLLLYLITLTRYFYICSLGPWCLITLIIHWTRSSDWGQRDQILNKSCHHWSRDLAPYGLVTVETIILLYHDESWEALLILYRGEKKPSKGPTNMRYKSIIYSSYQTVP
jgi:hypothetical protein